MKKIVKRLIVNEEYFEDHKAIPFTLNKETLKGDNIITWTTIARFFPDDMKDRTTRLNYIMNNVHKVGIDDMLMPDQPAKPEEECHELTVEDFSNYYESEQAKKDGTIWLIDKNYTSVFMTKETRDIIKEKYGRSVSLVYPAADCAVVRYYDKEKDIIGLTHSDAKRTGKNIIKNMTDYMKEHFNSNLDDIEVYVNAIAYDDWTYDKEPDFMYDKDKDGNVIGPNKEWEGYIEKVADDNYKIHYGDKIYDQISKSGIKEDNIYFSDDNTLFNKSYFSRSRSMNTGEREARNLFGITFDTEKIVENQEKTGVKLQ